MGFSKNAKGKLACDNCTSAWLYTSVKNGTTVCLKCGHGRESYHVEEMASKLPPLLIKFERVIAQAKQMYGDEWNAPQLVRAAMLALCTTSAKRISIFLHSMEELGYLDCGRLTPKAQKELFNKDVEKPQIKDEVAYIDALTKG